MAGRAGGNGGVTRPPLSALDIDWTEKTSEALSDDELSDIILNAGILLLLVEYGKATIGSAQLGVIDSMGWSSN